MYHALDTNWLLHVREALKKPKRTFLQSLFAETKIQTEKNKIKCNL